ncbi:membrane protein [Marmoricola endophyticus]|uniref:Membrane protein n=1 Tax=Marmoricola endophyticus TaxID=2040280 RepID=A0A917F882_9ACTN|nr:DMT family transporter [Marmoricola endophyticus]GGF55996.1 membrane protein [Marmoricola endophyticus]
MSRSGLLLAAVAAASMALSGALGRGLMDAGWSSAAAVTARIWIGALVLTPLAVRQLRGRWGLLLRAWPTLLAYGLVAVVVCQLAYFNAIAHMQVGVALLVEYISPVAVVTWLWLRHGQRPTATTVTGAAVAAVGLVLVLDLISGAQVSAIGMFWALLAMIGSATYFVMSSDERHGLPGSVLAAGGLVVGGVGLLLAGAVGAVSFEVSAAPVTYQGVEVAWWLPVLALGVVTAGLSYLTGIAATRRLGSRLASFVAMSEVLAALGWAWLLLGELPRGVQLVGGVLILLGVIVVKAGEPTAAPAQSDVVPGPRAAL